ncbi:MAG: c-type cytochrome [Dehalococcoidia bacterium]|nr:c-type cytochrome [Dehalococcoidia bacterium]
MGSAMKEAALAVGLTAVLAAVVVLTVNAGGDDGGPEFVMPTAAPSTPVATVDPDAPPEALGEQLANQNGCFACHTTDGSASAGPTWAGLFGSTRPLEGGGSVTADAEYIERSIRDPQADVAQGFQPIMPTSFGESLSDDEINALVAFIETLN